MTDNLGTNSSRGFSGSYDPQDITFLLQDIDIDVTDIAEKEAAIQNGTRHYSEMISQESAPSAEYKSIFSHAMNMGAKRLARDIAALAKGIDEKIDGPITLASLVRAGAPAGVLLFRALKLLGRDVEHYGISIIRITAWTRLPCVTSPNADRLKDWFCGRMDR